MYMYIHIHNLNLCILIYLSNLKAMSLHLYLQYQSQHHMVHSRFLPSIISSCSHCPQHGCPLLCRDKHPSLPSPTALCHGCLLSLAPSYSIGTELYRQADDILDFLLTNESLLFLIFGRFFSKLVLQNDSCFAILNVPNSMINIWKTEK